MPPTTDVQGSLMIRDPGGVVLAVVLAAGFAGRLAYGFEWDELQLLHGAWAVGQGEVPFRDFFEHHPPLFHVLVAPFVASATEVSASMLLGVRLVATAVLVGTLVAFHRLVVRMGTTHAGAWTAIALVVVVPASGKLFELRADWLALAVALAGFLLLLRADELGSVRDGVVAGALLGIAVACTQKVVPMWAAALLWCIAPVGGGDVRRAARLAGGFVAGTAVPLALLAVAFGMLGALHGLAVGTVGVNLAWPREVDWRTAWFRASPALAGPLVLAALAAARVLVGRTVDAPTARASSLVALVWAGGLVSYLATPVPWEQSLLFFVAPWTAALALQEVDRLGHPGEPRTRLALVWLAGVVIAAATVPAPRCAYVVGVWIVVAAALGMAWRTNAGLRTVAAILLVPALVLFGRERTKELTSGRAPAQLAFAREAAALSAPPAPVMTLWDHVVPFRSAASYHWFLHPGVLQRFAGPDGQLKEIDAELVRALDDARPRLVIADRAGLDVLPHLAHRLASTCRLAVRGYHGSDAYVCGVDRAG